MEFPSWLEWLEWLVGSDWPHGNEDLMWQMGRDLEDVAGQVDDLRADLDHLLSGLGDAYPEGTGGEKIMQWLLPLRDGAEPEHHGSIKEIGENYRALAAAADGMGDQLQSAKLNFYIAGAWLVAELAWAAASGPFAPALEGTIFATARVMFRELGEQLANRITRALADRITNQVLKRIIPKLVYEIGQEALVEALQGTSQEFLVQTIQQQTGHTDGYDWGAMGSNAAISAIAGGTGGAFGLGANHFLPTNMGGWRGSLNGALTGWGAGAAGAGGAWLGGGLLTGNWEFDPRSLTGGAFSGAGPSALHGYAGHTDFGGRPVGSPNDGSSPASFNSPVHGGSETNPGTPGGTTDPVNGQRPDGTTDPAQRPDGSTDPAQRNNGATDPVSQQPSGTGDSGQQGGAATHPASSPVGEGDSGAGKDAHTTDDRQDQPQSNGDGPAVGGGRNGKPDVDAANTGDGGDSTHSSDSRAPGGDHTGGTTNEPGASTDTHGEHGTDSDTRGHESPAKSEDVAGRNEPNPEGQGTHPAEANTSPGSSPDTTGNGAVGTTPGVSQGGTPGHTGAPNSASPNAAPDARGTSNPNTGPNPTASQGGDTRAPGDTTKAAPGARSIAPGDGTAPKPVAAQPNNSTRGALGDQPHAAGPVQAGRTGIESTDSADHASQPADPANSRTDATGHPIDASGRPIDVAGQHADLAHQPTNIGPEGLDSVGETHRGSEDSADGSVAGVVPIPVHDPSTQHGPGRSDLPSDSRGGERRPPQHGQSTSIGDYDGESRTGDELDPDFLREEIKANLGLITPEDVAWNRDRNHFVLPDEHGTVSVRIGPTEDGAVAEFHARPDGSGYDVRVSPHARDEDVVRAVAHELAEIRLGLDPQISLDPDIDQNDDRPSELTPHLGGRFAELRVLTAQIDTATFDPARAQELPRLRSDLRALTDRLGLSDPAHPAPVESVPTQADTARELLQAHDPELARRLRLEQDGALSQRPDFDPRLTDAQFDQAAERHLAQLEQQLTGEHADDVVTAERQGLDGRMREEQSRRLFDPLFEPEAKAARRMVPGLLAALNPINAVINDPSLTGPDRARALHRALDAFENSTPENFRQAFGPENFARMHNAADAFGQGPDHITGVLDHATGTLMVDGAPTTLGDFLRDIDSANRGAAENGINAEYTVVVHDAVDGKSAVDVMPRPQPQHRLPLQQNAFGEDNARIPLQRRPTVPAAVDGGHTVDVGVGRSAFAVDLTPEADRSGGGLIIKTELASEFPIAGQRRRDLGILDPGPLTAPGSVMLFGNLLFDGNILAGPGNGQIARVYINNVSAELPDAAYHPMAAALADAMVPGGRIEVQWDMKPQEENGTPGDRGHILGTKLWQAIEAHYGDSANPFRVVESTHFEGEGNTDYDYTIDAGASNNLDTQRMAGFARPLPEHRMVIEYHPAPDPVAAHPAEITHQPDAEHVAPQHENENVPRPETTTPAEPNSSLDEADRFGEQTDAGIAHHGDDPAMADLARRVPHDPNYFSADVHITEDGNARIGDRTYSPEQYAGLVRRSDWDGTTPIRVIGCDAAANDFASRLSAALGVDVLAATKPVWTDEHGRVYTSTADIGPDGNRRPRIPPDGEWQIHRPDGTEVTAAQDGFAPGTPEADKHGLNPEGARDRSAFRDDMFADDEPHRRSYEDIIGDRPVKEIKADDALAPKRRKPFGRDDRTGAPIKLDVNTAYRVTDRAGRDRGLFVTGPEGLVHEVHTDSGRKQTRDLAQRRLIGDGFNPDLKRPFPEASYRVDERFQYTTDTQGRVVVAHGKLDLFGSDEGRRGPDQTPIGHVGGKEYAAINKDIVDQFKTQFGRTPSLSEVILYAAVTFDGGHLFGTEFGGPGEAINMVPMLTSLNQDPGETTPLDNWRKLEGHWEHLLGQDPPPLLQVRIDLDYDPNSPNMKTPAYIDVEYLVDGVLVDTLSFKNIPPRRQ